MNHAAAPADRTRRRRPHVVIIGGGFGGLNAAKALRRAPVDVTLIDRRNFHLFQPLLYQVATGGLSPANIAAPLRHVLSRQKNCEVLMGEVAGIDMAARQVLLKNHQETFDVLIVAAGASHSYFGRDDWAPFAPGLKTIEDATEMRARVFTAFEAAELERHPDLRQRLLNFVIVGGGPTGVELAGALAEIARHSLKQDFRSIHPEESKISLIEAANRILLAFPEDLSSKAERSLERLGVDVRKQTKVTGITADHVILETANGTETLPTATVLWAAGVQASPLAKMLAAATDAELDRAGRVIVSPDLSIPGHENIFVIGDMAHYAHQGGKPLPGVAPVAIQQGRFVARTIIAQQTGRPVPTFHYHDPGNLATIGKSAAVADFGRLKFSGLLAWILWLVVHLMNIVTFRNRVLVLVQWGWSYFSHDRSARLITGESTAVRAKGAPPPGSAPQP